MTGQIEQIKANLAERLRLMPDAYIGSGGHGYYHDFAAATVLDEINFVELISVAEAASELWDELLPHDYDPYWSKLGKLLGKIPQVSDGYD